MKKVLVLFFAAAILFSCEEGSGEVGVYKSSSLGRQGQVTIIMHDKLWKTKLGELTKKYLAPDINYFPQSEKLFDLSQDSHSGFNTTSKRQKNIVQFEINTHPKIESGITYLKDIWATDQVVIKIIGKSQQDLAQLFVDNASKIKDYLLNKEMTRIQMDIANNKNHLAEKQLIDKHAIGLTVPMDMDLVINNETFAAFERKRLRNSEKGSGFPSGPGDIQQYILIYHYPYKSDSTFTKDFQIAKRDSVLKIYMEGSTEGSHMITTPDSLAGIYTRERLMKGAYAYEVRGQYSMVKDFRGGPFLSVSMVDERNGRVVTVEGNVFCPKFNKREFMLELETIINSLSLY